MDASEFQQKALLFLRAADQLGRGKPLGMIDSEPIGASLSLEAELHDEIVRYLAEKHLVEVVDDSGRIIKVTSSGKDELAAALREPGRPTSAFPSVINVLHIGGDNRGSIQQGRDHLEQSLTITSGLSKEILDFLTRLKEELPKVPVSAEDRRDVEADIGTVEHQLKAHKPKVAIIRECWDSMKEKLKTAAVDKGWAWITAGLVELAQHLPHL